VWVDVTVRAGERIIGRSGGRGKDGEIDPWSHFVNAFVVDRDGFRIDRRNPQDIFLPLYSNQIPPGAADVVHYQLRVPPDLREPLTVELALRYRKFDTTYMKHVFGADYVNELPVVTIDEERVVFPVAGGPAVEVAASEPPPADPWMRWNDFGIGLLRRGLFRQAEEAFSRVEALGRPDGPLNLARVYLEEGRVTHDAPAALRRAAAFDPPAPAWSVLWFSGLVNGQNARFDEAIRDFEQILDGGFAQAAGRGFDFNKDYRLLNELGQTLYERAKQERGERQRETREAFLERARERFLQVLALDPEDLTAHYNLSLIYGELGHEAAAAEHARLHAVYKPDDNARDLAFAAARRRYPAANRAAERVVIYDLQRPGAYGLPGAGGPQAAETEVAETVGRKSGAVEVARNAR
jgi:tetratricopeptide (TPR) repeat protein